ncbi:MAG TPA: glycoside hydrolase family 2 TIM barrel-domain containing protein [Chryseosolibacter sp.]|nr:glycoside hydrolase family 2 TIM barrel-domain containing protein [Chryseosolibacter sp.]
MLRAFVHCLVALGICSNAWSQETQRVYLSGVDKDHTVNWDFYCSTGRNSGVWGKIPVPSCWEMQGFGSYHYGWEEDYKKNEVGQYRFKFSADPSWKNKSVKIVFEGSMTDTEVRVNGKLAGPVHRGSFYRFKYDITSMLKAENLLEVKVSKISADTSVNRAERMSDFWVFGGIFRPVYLEILPREHIDWTAVDARADGSFLMHVYPSASRKATHVQAQIYTIDKKPLGPPLSVEMTAPRTTLRTHVPSPATWNPEHPNLHLVEVRLMEQDRVLHKTTVRFGFRTIEFREGSGFFVNGQRIVFKGVNRHSYWPTSGRTTSKQISILDATLIKEMNMNSVRMSHYPPDEHFLDVCDSLGLFVLDELGGWQKKYDTPVGRELLREMLIRDVNHPSIVVWDNGNEGGNNHDLVPLYGQYDPQQRKVIHPWNIFNGTDTQHYKGYDCCAGSLNHGNLVFFPTEILHGLYDGGNGAGLNDHWKQMMSNPLSAGCFLWAFADEGVLRTDRDSTVDVKGDRAPDGIVGPFREKEGSFFTIKEIWSPVRIEHEILPADFDGKLTVHNDYFFTNLRHVLFSWKLVKFPSPWSAQTETVVGQGSMPGPDIAPASRGLLHLDSSRFRDADALLLTATDWTGKEIFTWSWPLKSPARFNLFPDFESAGPAPSATEDDSTLTVTAGKLTISFSRGTGFISGVRKNQVAISLRNGPALVWGASGLRNLKHFRRDNNYVVECAPTGDMKYLTYTISPSGVVRIDYGYSHYRWDALNAADFLGVTFQYPEEKVNGVRMLAYGPYRVWRNRKKGGAFRVWNKPYNNTVTGESWDYPEFKGYYKNMFWVVVDNDESPFAVLTATPNLYLRLYSPEKPKGARNDFTAPSFPAGNISFLHGINAIGTKFDAASEHGPEGGKNKYGWEVIRGTLYLDFGTGN